MNHFGFGFEMVLAGLLPPGMDHFGFGFEMVLAGGRGVPSLARKRVVRIVKRGASRRTASSTAVTIPVDRRFPDERGMETPDGILPESTKKE